MKKFRLSIPDFIRHMILGWLLAVLTEYLVLPVDLWDLTQLNGLAAMSFPRLLGIAGMLTVLLSVANHFFDTKKVERWSLAAVFGMLSAFGLYASFTWPFLAACLLVLTALVVYGARGWKPMEIPAAAQKQSGKAYVWITAGLALGFFLFVSVWGVCRVLSFSTPTFDFGIFAQMFHSMKTTGLPMTTVERDGLLSHFAVHVSPIYYLMLPFYWLVPTPATLQVLQAAVLASAVIPLWKLGKHHGLSGGARTLCCALLLLYPAYAGGTSYDLHENCFLTPLILWLLYGIDRKNTVLTALFGVLTLMVKEDAAVYVAVVALWLLVRTLLQSKKDPWSLVSGMALLILALGWFAAVTGYLAKHGDGVMTYRYKNFMYDGSASLTAVIKAVILNPLKAVFECVDKEKLFFMAMTLLPLLGLPLLTRHYERYLLLIPYVLVNLMSDYTYQHDIFFQYTYGATAFLVYLTVVNLSDLKINRHQVLALLLAVLLAGGGFAEKVVPKAVVYPRKVIRYAEQNQQIRDVLAQLPEDASVASGTFYTTYLSGREILYDVKYCTRMHLLSTRYVVLDPSYKGDYKQYADENGENGYRNLITILEANGYVLREAIPGELEIYCKE